MDWKKIDEGLEENTSIKKAAKYVGKAYQTFNKRFKEKYDMEYKDYRAEKLEELGILAPTNSCITIDWDYVKEHFKADCSISSIASALKVSNMLLYSRCINDLGCTLTDLRNEYVGVGEDMIKKKMFDKAIEGDNKLLIFLSKNRLGYSEHPEKKMDTSTINFNFVDSSNNDK